MLPTLGLTPAALDRLTAEARLDPRRRKHLNLHTSYAEPCQRLLNAIEPDSYIRPHCHAGYMTNETLLALRGEFILIEFDVSGAVRSAATFGVGERDLSVCEVSPDTWHTVLSLMPGSVLFEAKSGPFELSKAKTFAPFSPEEGHEEARDYLETIRIRALEMAGNARSNSNARSGVSARCSVPDCGGGT